MLLVNSSATQHERTRTKNSETPHARKQGTYRSEGQRDRHGDGDCAGESAERDRACARERKRGRPSASESERERAGFLKKGP
jgi:hypothetical protein